MELMNRRAQEYHRRIVINLWDDYCFKYYPNNVLNADPGVLIFYDKLWNLLNYAVDTHN